MAQLDKITCEHDPCNEQIQGPQQAAHSMLVVLQKLDLKGYTYYQCNEGTRVDFHNWQHWHCSHDHMIHGVKKCIQTHYREEKLHGPELGTTYMHMIVLSSNLNCVICGKALTDQAYRFTLTHATPYNYVPDGHENMFVNWTCSLEHARARAVQLLNALPPVNGHNNGTLPKE